MTQMTILKAKSPSPPKLHLTPYPTLPYSPNQPPNPHTPTPVNPSLLPTPPPPTSYPTRPPPYPHPKKVGVASDSPDIPRVAKPHQHVAEPVITAPGTPLSRHAAAATCDLRLAYDLRDKYDPCDTCCYDLRDIRTTYPIRTTLVTSPCSHIHIPSVSMLAYPHTLLVHVHISTYPPAPCSHIHIPSCPMSAYPPYAPFLTPT
ncbi:extensin-like [Penaeus chinensis]|uniref:extensin-like n=1 Tax=Penaeus chinensis TaxID=139456 RepID=UPI001FB7C347|nr:extensin-like [Penaeus chinensis]